MYSRSKRRNECLTLTLDESRSTSYKVISVHLLTSKSIYLTCILTLFFTTFSLGFCQRENLILSYSTHLSTSNIYNTLLRLLSEGQFGTHLYLLLPYYDNGTLQSYLRTSNRALTSKQCLTFLHSLASAISYLHTGPSDICRPIVHRDIKSSNVLVANDELSLCLADFGVATILPQVLTEKDFVQIGTMRYMAPELLEGVITYTHDALYSVDMYALALVFWEILTQCDIYPLTGKDKKGIKKESL